MEQKVNISSDVLPGYDYDHCDNYNNSYSSHELPSYNYFNNDMMKIEQNTPSKNYEPYYRSSLEQSFEQSSGDPSSSYQASRESRESNSYLDFYKRNNFRGNESYRENAHSFGRNDHHNFVGKRRENNASFGRNRFPPSSSLTPSPPPLSTIQNFSPPHTSPAPFSYELEKIKFENRYHRKQEVENLINETSLCIKKLIEENKDDYETLKEAFQNQFKNTICFSDEGFTYEKYEPGRMLIGNGIFHYEWLKILMKNPRNYETRFFPRYHKFTNKNIKVNKFYFDEIFREINQRNNKVHWGVSENNENEEKKENDDNNYVTMKEDNVVVVEYLHQEEEKKNNVENVNNAENVDNVDNVKNVENVENIENPIFPIVPIVMKSETQSNFNNKSNEIEKSLWDQQENKDIVHHRMKCLILGEEAKRKIEKKKRKEIEEAERVEKIKETEKAKKKRQEEEQGINEWSQSTEAEVEISSDSSASSKSTRSVKEERKSDNKLKNTYNLRRSKRSINKDKNHNNQEQEILSKCPPFIEEEKTESTAMPSTHYSHPPAHAPLTHTPTVNKKLPSNNKTVKREYSPETGRPILTFQLQTNERRMALETAAVFFQCDNFYSLDDIEIIEVEEVVRNENYEIAVMQGYVNRIYAILDEEQVAEREGKENDSEEDSEENENRREKKFALLKRYTLACAYKYPSLIELIRIVETYGEIHGLVVYNESLNIETYLKAIMANNIMLSDLVKESIEEEDVSR